MNPDLHVIPAVPVSEVTSKVVEDEKIKEALKQALKEWLDEKFAAFGRWTFKGILAAMIFAAAYFFLITHGWKPPF